MYPFVFVAAAVACYFLFALTQKPRLGVIVAALVWGLYAVYEYFIANGTLCDANCNIRVDLLLIWPLVWIATLFGIYGPGQWTVAAKTFAGLGAAFVGLMGALSLYMIYVETPAAERAAKAESCTHEGGTNCPATPSSADGAPGAK